MDLTLWIVPIAYFRILWYTVLSSTLVVYLQLTTRHSLIMFCLFWGVIIIMCKYFAPLDVCLRAVEQLRMCTCMSLWASKLMSFCPLSLSLSHSLFSPPPPSPLFVHLPLFLYTRWEWVHKWLSYWKVAARCQAIWNWCWNKWDT